MVILTSKVFLLEKLKSTTYQVDAYITELYKISGNHKYNSMLMLMTSLDAVLYMYSYQYPIV